jgi:hypothetical protein
MYTGERKIRKKQQGNNTFIAFLGREEKMEVKIFPLPC